MFLVSIYLWFMIARSVHHQIHPISMAQDFLDQEKEIIEHVLVETDMSFSPLLLIPDINALNMIQNYMTDTMGVMKNKIDVDHLVDSSFILDTH